MPKLTILALGLGVAMSTLGLANEHQTKLFKHFDRNHDGKLSESEFTQAVMTSLFQKFDQNQDGKVTRDEFFQLAKDKELAATEYPKIDKTNKGYIVMKDVESYAPLTKELRASFQQVLPKGQKSVSLEQLKNLQQSQ